MSETPSLLPVENGELHDFEITYADPEVPFSTVATCTHIVRGCKSIPNAMRSFDRAVPRHGIIRKVRKLT